MGEKWVKKQFSIEILVYKFYKFLKKFQILIGYSPNAQRFAARFLSFF